MQARFLLGPAGSGKSFRCVAEVRAELLRSPEGPPLVFLAPKQATFQIERQLLSGEDESVLRGYTRLNILSFERLAAFVLAQSGHSLPETLTEEGRVMVLRALLARHHAELKLFRATARLTGFATQLSTLLRELQSSQVTVHVLTKLAAKVHGSGRLPDKLHDLALLLERYEIWLQERRLSGARLDDAGRLLDLAAETLRERTAAGESLGLDGLWLDGFAEMTPQETALLAALVPHCQRATLAFCLDGEARGDGSWLSPWSVVGGTFLKCRAAVTQALKSEPEIEVLPRDPSKSRFSGAPDLLRLERAWVEGGGLSSSPDAQPDSDSSPKVNCAAVRLVACPNAEVEATLVAREIRRHVLAGGRYRECAVLVRSLDEYHDVLRRVLSRYDIPFFLDRREPVAHHPLAELTRYALRVAAFDWRTEDWLGVLKSGLAGIAEGEVDWLENEALKRGWEGRAWREPIVIPNDVSLARQLEAVRERVLPPFAAFASALNQAEAAPDGPQLAAAIAGLWRELRIEQQLEAWGESAETLGLTTEPHGTVWAQLNDWLANLERAFAGVSLSLREWLPIIEAGFAGMTVGVIPPSLDQVLVGSVDRSRNPDLRRVFVLGVNEGVFPAPPIPAVLLTDSDRLELEAHGLSVGTPMRNQLGHERYFGYIAFTRARQQLVVTWAQADEDGAPLNASTFVSTIQRALPQLKSEFYTGADRSEAVHRSELAARVLASDAPGELAELPDFAPLVQRQREVGDAVAAAALSPEAAGQLYGNELQTSVSALEDFAGCPFKFLAARGLRAQERDEFVVDARQRGSFQHDILQKFHERVRAQQRRWRDLTPDEARQLVREIGAECAANFQGGLLQANEARRFAAGVMIGNLEELLVTLVGWAAGYAFDPTEVEVSFGLPEAKLPAWKIPLANGRSLQLRGRIDRVDICRLEDGRGLVVICDYKSSARQMDTVKIQAGLELQLLSYLAALSQMPEARAWLGAERIIPAGVFYIPLKGRAESTAVRMQNMPDASDTSGSAGAQRFQHRGRFDAAWLKQFDASGAAKGEQFRISLKKDGSPALRGNDGLPEPEFPELVSAAEARLRELGERIFSGEAAVRPCRHKKQTACDLCAYRAVCRFDPWVMPFRSLKEGGA